MDIFVKKKVGRTRNEEGEKINSHFRI